MSYWRYDLHQAYNFASRRTPLFKSRAADTTQEAAHLSTKRSKRWNGNLDSLAPEFLKEVMEKMEAYGDRVQFQSPGRPAKPSYQVINPTERKMGFDERHLLLRLNEDGNISDELTPIYAMEAVRAAMLRSGRPATRATPARRPASSKSPAAAPVIDTVEQDKYAYFKEHRETLPEGIAAYSQEISRLMKAGLSAEAAFQQIIDQHF
ncbi:hypothetical protein CKA81_02710 [Pollutimonas thiosulfatoxidans]|uniref:Uncharacterized protein n=1 Tax=Pollutimonas thiosulfatoxidans TaxID=2028345 RepID=A0A410G980_9BURK|nr:hypothetical protein CKA81_02710 [Pollutimonas thiosulfatoxidans]